MRNSIDSPYDKSFYQKSFLCRTHRAGQRADLNGLAKLIEQRGPQQIDRANKFGYHVHAIAQGL